MKHLTNLFQNESFLVIFISVLFILASFSPTIYEAFQAGNLGDPNRVFLWGEHNHTYDYNVYLSKMLQGAIGRWTMINKYTSEPHQGVFLQVFYLYSGKLGGFFGFPPPLAYQLLRLILSLGLCLAIYRLISFFLLAKPAHRLVAFILCLLAGSFPHFVFYNQAWHITSYMDWWQEFDQIKRAAYVPHYMLGHILTIVSFLSLLKAITGKSTRLKFLATAAATGFLAGLVHPPSLLVVWGIAGFLGLYHLIPLIRSRLSRRHLSPVLTILAFVALSSLSLVYIQVVTSQYPWKSLVESGRAAPWNFPLKDLILAYGLNLPLGIFGLFLSLRQKRHEFLPLIFWVITVPLGMIVFKLTGLYDISYFFQVAFHLPLAILSTFFLFELSRILKPRLKVNLLPVFIILFLLTVLPGMYFSLKGQFQFIDQRAAATLPLVPYPSQVMYPLRDWWNGIQWLNTNTHPEDIVLSGLTAGNYIPAYSGNTVYLGHGSETAFFSDKNAKTYAFFSGSLSPEKALEFLVSNRISYVFHDPQTKEIAANFDLSTYSFLKPVYQSNFVTIYRVAL